MRSDQQMMDEARDILIAWKQDVERIIGVKGTHLSGWQKYNLESLVGGKWFRGSCHFLLGIPKPGTYGAQVPYQEFIHTFSLVPLPGCCGVLISTGAYTNPKYRNLGINKLSNGVRQDLAAALGYTVLLCTDQTNNEAERKTLKHHGFTDIFKFTNARTGHEVAISAKEVA